MNRVGVPLGSRDLLFQASQRKQELIQQFQTHFDQWGYQMIETPGLEYLDTFKSTLTNQTDNFIKVISSDQEVLTLRSDMTVPIARVVATKFKNHKKPLRISYTKNVFSTQQKYTGHLSELTDCGGELIGVQGQKADLEILLLILTSMSDVVDQPFILELGDVRFFRGISKYVGLTDEQIDQLAALMNDKNLPALDKYVDELGLNDDIAQFFKDLPSYVYNGGQEVLEKLRPFAVTDELTQILDETKSLVDTLVESGYQDNIRLDFAKIPSLDYYSGLIFEGYVDQVGQPVVSGGRYDKLVGQFGSQERPAIGFAIKTDHLIDVVLEQADKPVYIVDYPAELFVKAHNTAQEMRFKENKTVILQETDQKMNNINIRMEEDA